MYEHYKKARDMAWTALIESNIQSLPVDLWKVAECYDFRLHAYSKCGLFRFLKEEVRQDDGFIACIGNRKEIFINDKIHNRNHRRFTLAHELGHGILDHDLCELHFRSSEINSHTDIQELETNVFARDLLMPATVLAALDIHTPDEIIKICEVSRQSAEIRAERMQLLYERDKFNRHPLERQIREQFDDFIRNFNRERSNK